MKFTTQMIFTEQSNSWEMLACSCFADINICSLYVCLNSRTVQFEITYNHHRVHMKLANVQISKAKSGQDLPESL